MKSLKDFPFINLKSLKKAIIVCHRRGDVDAFASAYSLIYLLRKLKKGLNVKVGIPEGLNLQAKKLSQNYKVPMAEKDYITLSDLIIIVDTGHSNLLEDWLEEIKKSKAYKIFIDHHPLNESVRNLADKIIVNEDATSTTEIIYKIFESKKIKPSRKVSEMLMAGILYDTQFLTIASPLALKAMAKLCTPKSLEKVRNLLKIEKDYSEVIAKLKGAQRMKIYKVGDWIFTYTEIGSFHASVARALINLGADLSLVLGEVDGEIRGSFRSTPLFFQSTKIHLGTDLAEWISKMKEGVGGGHATASSFTVKSKDDLLNLVLNFLKEKIGGEIKVIS